MAGTIIQRSFRMQAAVPGYPRLQPPLVARPLQHSAGHGRVEAVGFLVAGHVVAGARRFGRPGVSDVRRAWSLNGLKTRVVQPGFHEASWRVLERVRQSLPPGVPSLSQFLPVPEEEGSEQESHQDRRQHHCHYDNQQLSRVALRSLIPLQVALPVASRVRRRRYVFPRRRCHDDVDGHVGDVAEGSTLPVHGLSPTPVLSNPEPGVSGITVGALDTASCRLIHEIT